MIKTGTFIICLMSLTLAQAQAVNIDEFKCKLIITEYLLTQQPSKEVIAQHVPVGYQLDSLKSYGYYFTDRESKPVGIHLDFSNKKILGILFSETKERHQSLVDFLKSEKKYKTANFVPSGKLFFFSDGIIAITLNGNDPVNVVIMANLKE